MRNKLKPFLADVSSALPRLTRLGILVVCSIFVALVGIGLVSSETLAQAIDPIVIDFETNNGVPLNAGDVVTTITVDGITMTVVATGGIGEAWIFDSSDPSGGDEDLGTPNETCTPSGPGVGSGGEVGEPGANCEDLGNILIIQENADGIPDDAADGGTLTLTFSEPVFVESFDLLDFEAGESSILSAMFFDVNGVELDANGDDPGLSITPTGLGDNSYELFTVNQRGIARIELILPISGAIADVRIIPEGSIGDTITCVDTGEGLGGVEVSLTGLTSGVITQITEPDGTYLFDNLPLGTYSVTVNQDTLPDTCNVAAVDPDGVLDNTSTTTITRDAPDDLEQDFAYTSSLGSIGDQVWCDDGNGTFEAGEGIDGISVTLSNATGVVSTTTTGPDGAYLFQNLALGDYTVAVGAVPAPCNEASVDPDAVLDSISAVTLTAAVPDDLDQDFAYVEPLGSIGDTIFCDANDNGLPDPGEGSSGVSVTITDSSGTATTLVTDADGIYNFTALPIDTYVVTVDPGSLPALCNTPSVDPDDGAPNSSTVVLTPGEPDDPDQDFGYVAPPPTPVGSIGDTIFCDTNGSGAPDAGEGLPGVTVSLSNAAGPVTNTTTDANGIYTFPGLPFGDYTVTVDPNSIVGTCVEPSVDPDGSATPNTSNVSITAAAPDNPDQDFGYVEPAAPLGSIGDTIFCDANGNGTPDAGEGTANVTVTLTLPDGTTQNAETNGVGQYLFENLPAGDYTVAVDPADLDATCNVPSVDPDQGNDNTSAVTLAPGEDNMEQDFGYVAPPADPGSIGDTIFCDANGSGTFDAGEGVAGVLITLSGSASGTQTTDANGSYLFEGLPAGDYTVAVDPAGLDAMCNTPTVDPDDGNDNTSSVTLTEGEDNLEQDFGYQLLGCIGDRVWLDANANGLQDAGEAGIGGANVTVTDAGGATVGSVSTDENGNYQVCDLPEGTYTVAVVGVDAAYSQTFELDGTLDASSSAPLGPGQIRDDVDFGYTPIIDLALTKSASITQTGPNQTFSFVVTVVNEGDHPATGVSVSDQLPTGLTFQSANASQGAYDNATSIWTIGNMAVGQSVSLTVTVVSGGNGPYTNVAEIATTDQPDRDSVPDNNTPEEDDQEAVTISGGADPVSVGDRVWIDANEDGLQSDGEIGLPGVTVTIYNSANAQVGQAVTGPQGEYKFENLPPDSYSVEFQLPDGYGMTTPEAGDDDAIDSDAAQDTNRTPAVNVPSGENLTLDAGVVPIVLEPNLTIAKRVNDQTFVRGDTITYIIDYANTGTGVAEDVVLTEGIPAHTTFESTLSSSGWSCVDSACTFPAGNMDPGATGTVQFTLRISEDLPAEITQIECAVSITSSNTPPGGATSTSTTVNVTVPTDIETNEEPGVRLFFYIPIAPR